MGVTKEAETTARTREGADGTFVVEDIDIFIVWRPVAYFDLLGDLDRSNREFRDARAV